MSKRAKILVARNGSSLDTAAIYKRTLDSTKNHLKVSTQAIGSIIIPASGGGMTRNFVIVLHNLGYIPFVDVYARDSGDTVWQKVPIGLDIEQVATSVNEDELVINFYNPDIFSGATSEHTIEYKYLIYVDPARDGWYT